MPKALFRCDASKQIGTGHVVRCLTLANELRKNGWTCAFSVSAETLQVVPMLSDSGFETMEPDSQADKYDLAIFDHYFLDASSEEKMRLHANYVLVIDDLANRRHDCDILVDQTYGRSPSDYKSLTPEPAHLLTGTQYALLRDQFAKARPAALERRAKEKGAIRNLFVLISGTDPDNVTLKVLSALESFGGLSVDLVLGHIAAERMNIQKLIAGRNIKWHRDVRDMAGMMSAADLAIGAGGTASWERCCLGLPTINIIIADNQELISRNLEEDGAICNLGWHTGITPGDIAACVNDLIQNPDKIVAMSEKAATICDGLGAGRVVEEINRLVLS